MITKELIDYIKSELEKGISEDVIKTNLINTGWTNPDIDEAFSKLNPSESSQQISPIQDLNKTSQKNYDPNKFRSSFDLFDEAWSIFIGRFKTIFAITILPFMLSLFPLIAFGIFFSFNKNALINKFSGELTTNALIVYLILGLLGFLIFLIVQAWSQTALLVSIASEEKIGVKESFKKAWGKINSYFWIVFLTGLITFGGFILFFIPGIIFSFWFSFASFVFICEDARGMTALLKSKEYVKGHFWIVFKRFLLGFLISIGVIIIILLLNLIPSIGQVMGSILQILLAPLGLIYLYVIYKDFKRVKGDFEFVPKRKGLFIAIGIFGILIFFVSIAAAAALVAINPAKQLNIAKEAQAKASIGIIQSALENYRVDNGSYPITLQELAPTYIKEVPIDPLTKDTFEYYKEGGTYNLCTRINKARKCFNTDKTPFSENSSLPVY